MSHVSVPNRLDNAEYLLTYELDKHSTRTLIFLDPDELREFLADRGMDKEPASFAIWKQCRVNNQAFIAGDNDDLMDYIRITGNA